MRDDMKGFCIVEITKALMEAAADVNNPQAATAVGRIVATAVQTSPHQPCVIVKIEIVESSVCSCPFTSI